ncbi:MAG: four helix bundle protein [Bacteroidetes bacterium]|nr:four helix bundle protein [Bacteroidota bacterium]
MKGFEDLEAWKEARKFRIAIIALTKTFPKHEQYLLMSQLKRASRSVTANIAEGYGRYHYQENIQFCRQSRGSLEECKDHLYAAYDEEYMNEQQLEALFAQHKRCISLLNGYIDWLKKQKEKN